MSRYVAALCAGVVTTSVVASPAFAIVDGSQPKNQENVGAIARVETTFPEDSNKESGSGDKETENYANEEDGTSSEDSSNNDDSAEIKDEDNKEDSDEVKDEDNKEDSSDDKSSDSDESSDSDDDSSGSDDISSGQGYGSTICTGVLIAPEWILTAKHCVDKQEAFSEVTLGETPESTDKIEVDSVVNNDKVDLSLLHLSTPSAAQPLKISSHTVKSPTPGAVYGWGDVDDQGVPAEAENLTADIAQIQPKVETDSAVPGMKTQRATLNSGQSTYGDSGSPFIINGKVYGILSQGVVHGDDQKTTDTVLYALVSPYGKWINETTGEKLVSSPQPASGHHKSKEAGNKPSSPAKKGNKKPSHHAQKRGHKSHSSAHASSIDGRNTAHATAQGGAQSHAQAGIDASLAEKIISKVEKKSGKRFDSLHKRLKTIKNSSHKKVAQDSAYGNKSTMRKNVTHDHDVYTHYAHASSHDNATR